MHKATCHGADMTGDPLRVLENISLLLKYHVLLFGAGGERRHPAESDGRSWTKGYHRQELPRN